MTDDHKERRIVAVAKSLADPVGTKCIVDFLEEYKDDEKKRSVIGAIELVEQKYSANMQAFYSPERKVSESSLNDSRSDLVTRIAELINLGQEYIANEGFPSDWSRVAAFIKCATNEPSEERGNTVLDLIKNKILPDLRGDPAKDGVLAELYKALEERQIQDSEKGWVGERSYGLRAKLSEKALNIIAGYLPKHPAASLAPNARTLAPAG